MALVDIGGQFVDSSNVLAVLLPTSNHVGLTAGADIQLRSVLVLDGGLLVPCSLTPSEATEALEPDRSSVPHRKKH